LSIRDFTIEIEQELELLKFDSDIIFDEMENAEDLLLNSRSGFNFYGIDIDYGDNEEFHTEYKRSDKIPGKILSHRIMDDDSIEILMKWKYLSYEESTWIKIDQYKDLLIVRDYSNKFIK
jgi:hypothetical protein